MTTAAALDVARSRDEAVTLPVAAQAWTLALVMLGALALAVGVATLDATPIGVQKDDSMYVILAKSLATGQGYRFLNLPGAPAATHFPPGYPALLAILWRMAPEFPANLMVFKAANALFLAAVGVATATLARRRLVSAPWAIAAGLLATVSVPVLVLSSMVMSELCFLALLLLMLPHLEAFVDRPAPVGSVGRAALLGVGIGVCMLVRTHAVVLIPAVALVLLVRRRWGDAMVLSVGAIGCLLPWQLWSAHHAGALPAPLLGEYDSYLGWWMRGYSDIGPAMIGQTLQQTTNETIGMFAVLFSPARGDVAHTLTLLALVCVAGIGLAYAWRRVPVTLLFLAGYLTIIALWPFPPSRFVWGVWPLLLLVLLSGARTAVAHLREQQSPGRRWLYVVGSFAALWIAAGYGAYEYRAVRGQWWSSISRANARRIEPAIRWTLANTAPGDLVATEDDGAVYLYTGRHTIPVRTFTAKQYLADSSPESDAREGLIPLLAAFPAQVVIVGSAVTLAQAQWLAAQSDPRIARSDSFPGGAAFTVLHR